MKMDLDDQFCELSSTFTTWLKDSSHVTLNPKIGLADLRTSYAGRGVVALSPLEQDETVFTVPRSSVLSVENSELFEKLREELTVLDPWLALILVLIYETRSSSPWKPYIDILPRSFDTLMYWSGEELTELQASAVVSKIGKDEVEEVFREKLWPIVKKHAELFVDTDIAPGLEIDAVGSLVDTAHRMGSIIMSYSFDLELSENPARGTSAEDSDDDDEGKTYKGMVPMADMLNADADRNNCRLFQTPTTLEMRTTRPIPANDELFNDYGPLPRSDLLRRYGYITPNYAQYDVAEISFKLITEVAGKSLDQSDKIERIDYLLDEGILDDAFDIGTDLEVPEEVLIVVGSLLLTNEEFTILKQRGRVARAKKSKEVGRVLKEAIEQQLNEYGSSTEDDEKILSDKSVQGRKRTAVEVRLGEKRILSGVLAKVKDWIRLAERKRDESSAADGEGGRKKVRIQ